MYQTMPRVLEHEKISEGYFRLSLESPEVAENAVPGQFVMVKVGGTNDPLLRRPFSIHRINKGSGVRGQGSGGRPGIEILYKVIGKGTGMMAHIKTGEEVDIIGPLGRGFTFESNLKEAVIVGGGIGAAPMLALAEALRESQKSGAYPERSRRVRSQEKRLVTVFLGGRGRHDILCVKEFEELGADVYIATDDGSLGHKGFVTELLEQYLGQPQGTAPTRLTSHVLRVFSCGPHLMSKKVAEISKKFSIPCQVSLEAHMACGVGACLGCVIKIRSSEFGVRSYPIPSPTLPLKGREFSPLHQGEGQGEGGVSSAIRNPQSAIACGCDSEQVPCDTQLAETSYKRVCMEGPVFDAEEVVWE